MKRGMKGGGVSYVFIQNFIFLQENAKTSITDRYLGHSHSEFNLNIDKLPLLNPDDLRYLELLGKGAFGVVQKAYDKRTCSFLALKYCKPNKNESLDSIWEEIGPEDYILTKIEELNNPLLLKYHGIMQDSLNENNLVLVMESGEATIKDFLRAEIYLSLEENLFIFKQLVKQLDTLQMNGIANRDIKPANIIIIRNEFNNEYRFKVADFGIGCHILEQGRNHISNEDLKGCTSRYAAPEVKSIYNKSYKHDYYDPFLSDVYSLGRTLREMIPPNVSVSKIEKLISLMTEEKPKNRITFRALKTLLKSHKYKKMMRSPSPIKIKEYIEQCKQKKDENKSTATKIDQYLTNLQLYDEISHFEQAGEYVNLLENLLQKLELNEYLSDGPLIAKAYNNLAVFYKNIKQDFTKVEIYYEKALNIRLNFFGELHKDTADTFNNLAVFYKNIRHDYQKAEAYYEKALKVYLSVFGEIHPDTAYTFNNLAVFYETIKHDYIKAEEYYEKALKTKLIIFGEMHADTANTFTNLAVFYKNIKQDYNKAEEYYSKALKAYLQSFGEMNVETARLYFNFGIFTRDVKNEENSGREMIEKALEIWRRILGENHPLTQRALSVL